MQLDLLTLNQLPGIQHILNQLTVRGSGWVQADDALWLILAFLVGRSLVPIPLIAVQGILTRLVGCSNGRRQQAEDIISHRLVAAWMTDDDQGAVESSFLLRTVIESVPAAGHQRHADTASHKQGHRILAPFQSGTHILQQREMREQRFNLLTPRLQLSVHRVTYHTTLFASNKLLIRLPRHGLDALHHFF